MGIRKRWIAACALLITTNAFAYKNEPDGFRGINWGDSLVMHEEQLEEIESEGNTKFYTRKDDKMNLGGAELIRLAYGYKDGKFVSVLIKTQGYSNKKALIDAFNEQFGYGLKPNRFMDKQIWTGSKTNIMLDCNNITDNCTAALFSSPAMKADREKSKQRAKDAAADF